MDAYKSAVIRPVFLSVLALIATTAPTNVCRAGGHEPCSEHGHGRHFDGSTLCRWHRTWNGPNAIWTPLTPYYIPRPADPCKYGGYGHGCYGNGCGFAVEDGYFSEDTAQYEDGDLTGYAESQVLPVGLERLGQIPNDLGISAGSPAAPARPGR
jgi:hypothetical protein